MFKFGFELEGFYTEDGIITIPPKEYPTDGFPGLVELRTRGPNDLLVAFIKTLQEAFQWPNVDFSTSSATFTAEQRAILRRRQQLKDAWDIRNIYGKAPKLLGNRTIASCQINISYETQHRYWDKEGKEHPAVYGLFDMPQVIRNLDEEFGPEIKEAGRQPGEYCVKNNNRLEYRSLPNFVFPVEVGPPGKKFLDRIEQCVTY